MALNSDDLQRMRDAIRAGWDFKFCHEIDFQSVVTELIDDALEGGATLGQQVYDCFGDAPDIDNVTGLLQKLVDDVDDCGPDTVKGIDEVIDLLDDMRTAIDDKYKEAEALL